ncbi:DNA repair protein XRCC2-like [Diadema antillarum]|uniref:DNA repair protein XRCC2-like n=1 Tax=Diadema antillarum TaxID=105358 RepID=UPI003A881D1D
MAAANSETGAQLLVRLGEKSSLDKLDPALIPPEFVPRPGDVVEVYGGSGAGKTELLLNVTATCILPPSWEGINIGGIGTSVVFLDTEQQFSMVRLFTIMESRVNEALAHRSEGTPDKGNDQLGCSDNQFAHTDHDREERKGNTKKCGHNASDVRDDQREQHISHNLEGNSKQSLFSPSEEEVESFLKSCLKKLYIVKIVTSDQLIITLHSLESLLANQCGISVVLVDTISAFHWLDKMSGGDSVLHQGTNQKLAFTALSRLLKDYHLVAFAAKAALVTKRAQSDPDAEHGDDSRTPHSRATPSALGFTPRTEHHEFMSKEWTRLVSHRIVLERHDSSAPLMVNGIQVYSTFSAVLSQRTTNKIHTSHFIVTAQGIVHV